MLDQISEVSRASDIRSTLKQAPHDLVEMIRHVFERLAGDPAVQKDDLNEMLTWVTFAPKLLLLGQMDVILKLRGEIGEGVPDLEDRLRGQFSSFFTLDREDTKTTESLQLESREKRQRSISYEEHSSVPTDTYDLPQIIEDLEDEDDEMELYDSDFKTTRLGFSHASIRDYLVQEGRSTTRKYPEDLGIGVDVNKAEHHITKTCLSILCDTEHKFVFSNDDMLEYAADNFLKHLQKIERSSLTLKEKEEVIRPLIILFQSDLIMRRWIVWCSDKYSLFVQKWLNDRTLARCVRGWFADADIMDLDFTTQEKGQLQYASKSGSSLWEKFAKYCASQWLSRDSDDDTEFYVWILHVYTSLVSTPISLVITVGCSA